MKSLNTTPDLSAKPGLARFAAHAGDTETWIDAAGSNLTDAEKNHAIYSAAPDLLEALRGLAEIVEDLDPETVNFNPAAAVEAARAAIAKAEGRA